MNKKEYNKPSYIFTELRLEESLACIGSTNLLDNKLIHDWSNSWINWEHIWQDTWLSNWFRRR